MVVLIKFKRNMQYFSVATNILHSFISDTFITCICRNRPPLDPLVVVKVIVALALVIVFAVGGSIY